MRIRYAVFVLVTLLGVGALWATNMTNDSSFTFALLVAGVVMIAATWTLGAWLRNRRRRRLMEMRDSALW